MRFSEPRFSIPFAILNDDLPDKAIRLLIFLFSQSDFNGACSPGYKEMKAKADIGSDATIANTLRLLQRKGWIFHIKKGGSNRSTIWLQIPPRFRSPKRQKLLAVA